MSTYFYLVHRKILFLVKHFLLFRGWGTHSFFLGVYRWPKSTKMMASKTKAFAIASWAFSSAMETFVNPMADATAEMHF